MNDPLRLALQECEARYRALTSALSELVWTLGADFSPEYLNERWLEFTGRSVEEIRTLGWESVIHPDDLAKLCSETRRASDEGEPCEVDFRLRRVDGAYRWMLGRVVPLKTEDGTIVKWVGTTTDVDDRRRMEEALEESEHRRRLALSAARAAAWEYDLANDRPAWTPEMFELFGVAPGKAPTLDRFMELVHPEDRARTQEQFQAAIASGGKFEVEFRIVQPAGTTIWISSTGVVELGHDGQAVLARGVDQDISERKLAEARLRENEERLARLYEEAQRAIRARDQLASIVSHDLRSPLGSIVMQTALLLRQLQRGVPDSGHLAAALGRIERASTKMDYLIGDLLDLARAQSRQPVSLARQPTMLGGVIMRVIEDHRRSAPSRNVRLASGANMEIIGTWDTRRIERLVDHLVTNAIKHSPEGKDVVVSIDLQREGGREWVSLTVSDEGFGIAADDLPGIFEWYGPEREGPKGRTDVRLAGARQIVEQHGGTISVESEVGRGSTFRVKLPVVPEGDEEGPSAGSA
jgi:PAS domain S-box-containing protein